MQPTYIPWLGYFDLIDKSDIFVFLDSVQFDKRSWQQRNRIKTPRGELMLTVPVVTKGRFDQKIYDVEIDTSQKYIKKHLNSICSNYNKTKYFEDYRKELEDIYNEDIKKISQLNKKLIYWLSSKFGITTHFTSSSKIDAIGTKTELLVNICKQVGADHYISPAGSKGYIDQNNLFVKSKIKLSYQNYNHPAYNQFHGDFIPYMSAIDLLFNEGDCSLGIIRSGSLFN